MKRIRIYADLKARPFVLGEPSSSLLQLLYCRVQHGITRLQVVVMTSI